ncbi:MAG: peptidylprolyl isomerase [Thermoflexales bacterium]|nr:peptidylprolyl isomerase [Thermoflexales bacterium]
MASAQAGDTVRVHYTGKLDDGTVFDSSAGSDPIEFVIGDHQVIPGFEDGVTGMAIGETKTITIPFDQAYGAYDDELVLDVPRDQFPDHITPEIGEALQLQQPDGNVITVIISEVSDESVTLDANHPLAGEDLTFDLELAEIV